MGKAKFVYLASFITYTVQTPTAVCMSKQVPFSPAQPLENSLKPLLKWVSQVGQYYSILKVIRVTKNFPVESSWRDKGSAEKVT